MKKNLIIAFALSQFSILSAQTYEIKWGPNQDYPLTNGTVPKVPYFTNKDNYVLNGLSSVYFSIELEPTNARIGIKDVVYETQPFDTDGIIFSDLSATPSYRTLSHTDKGQRKTYFQLEPFIKDNEGRIRRIVRFSLDRSSLNTSKSLSNSSSNQRQSTQSVLKEGQWYKIKVDKTGVFKLDKSFFTKNGIPTSGFDLSKLKIYGSGDGRLPEDTDGPRVGELKELPIDFVGSSDNSFDSNDYVLFYAKGPTLWDRTNNPTLSSIKLRNNWYDDYSYYFIRLDGDKGKRITTSTPTGQPSHLYTQFDNYVYHEKDSLNINQLGREWVGEPLTAKTPFNKTFKLQSAVTGSIAYLDYSFVGKNAENTKVNLNYNGKNDILSIGSGTYAETFKQLNFPIQQGGDFVIDASLNNQGNPGGAVYVNYFQLRFKQNLNFENQQLSFRTLDVLKPNDLVGFKFATPGNYKVWNVSNIHSAHSILPEGTTFKYRQGDEDSYNELVAFTDETAFTDAKFSERVENADIRGYKNIDYVIVTHPKFLDQANRLADFRRRNDGIGVAVVTTKQVYNDFSSGAQDPFAIRDYLRFLRRQGNAVTYAILIGGSSYDFKDRIKNNTNFVPTFILKASSTLDSSISTDDYFSMIGDGVSIWNKDNFEYESRSLDVAIGRLPAHTPLEAKTMVDKIISHYEKIPGKGTSAGDWKTKLVMVSDKPSTTEVDTKKFDEDIESVLQEKGNDFYVAKKLYIAAELAENTSAGLRYPSVNKAILNALELGTQFIMYYGHGGPRSWAQSRIITAEELDLLNNFNGSYSRLPIVATITCDFTIWDLPQYDSAGELMLKNTNGGAQSMITTNRPINTGYGSDFNQYILDELFKKDGNKNPAIGIALNDAKKVAYFNNINQARVSLLGDPMIAIARPQEEVDVVQMKVNGVVVNTDHQVRALDFVEIEGTIKKNGQTDTNYNGSITNVLYEKPSQKTFVDNKYKEPVPFSEEYNTIYRGTSKVENGKFTIKYYVPKDINYEVSNRKLVLYAFNDSYDAVYTTKLKVGDINPNGINDKEIPQAKLYMNNLNFANGGITNRSPYLVGCLTDNTGINATGGSIGHDIVATLDGKIQESFVLNDYYEGGDANPCVNNEFEDYQKGQVIYQLKNLELGQHHVDLKFWDINNNSNTATLDFVVMENGTGQLHIDKLLNWPNPFLRNTYFHFEHNCDSDLEVLVQIFTVAGRLVKTIRQHVTSEPYREGFRTNKYAIEWDGLDDFGDKIGKGVYIYKINVKGSDQSSCKGNATAVEKLVILK